MSILSNCKNADALDHSLQQFDTGQNADYSDTGAQQNILKLGTVLTVPKPKLRNHPNFFKTKSAGEKRRKPQPLLYLYMLQHHS